MQMGTRGCVAVLSFVLSAPFSVAQAAVTISAKATANMSCASGVCAPTATDAVLNAGDLETLLASGNLTVTTTGNGVQAKDIRVDAALAWANGAALTFDAWRAIAIDRQVSIDGAGGLSIVTNDGGTNGELSFGARGHVTLGFNNGAPGTLSIDGANYTLVFTVLGLIASVAEDPSGHFALAADYNASGDGTYKAAVVQTSLAGTFEGLGNVISGLRIRNKTNEGDGNFGLFLQIGSGGTVADLGLKDIDILAAPISGTGGLTPDNEGLVRADWVSGKITAESKGIEPGSFVGGLVGYNGGTIVDSHADVTLTDHTLGAALGGLAASEGGTISRSYATGSIEGGIVASAGGLVGVVSQSGGATGAILDCYATGAVSGGGSSSVGGLVGTYVDGKIAASYSTGAVKAGHDSSVGGFLGFDQSDTHALKNDYWDTDTSGITDLSRGAGNIPNDPGITGLTTAQFQSGLPEGFDPTVWAENPQINDGLPYLRANVP